MRARYKTNTAFFNAVAKEAGVDTGSAKGTYYGFLRGARGLPPGQRAAYLKLLNVSSKTLDAIDALKPSRPMQRGRLEEVADTVDLLLERQTKTEQSLGTLRSRVRKLEDRLGGDGASATRPRRAVH